ncbi:type III pantothenate kinase [Candidatus Pelagibacter sp.]|nr:type III pantothenate kinase [Candidatus Pelagibacter sp.]
MILIGDIGNTDTKICLVNSNYKIIKKIIFRSKNLSKSILTIKIKEFLKNISITKSLFCSVVPKQYLLIKSLLYKNFKIKVFELKDIDIDSMIKIQVNKKQIGSDRLANAISVMSQNNNFIIIDFGTATTFDVVVNNKYRGGVIAPGVDLSLNTLTKRASLIPTIDLKKTKKVVGKDTISAVRAGFFWGYAGLIDNIVELIKKEENKKFKIIITGGLSNLFKKSLKSKIIQKKDITINGLIRATKYLKF